MRKIFKSTMLVAAAAMAFASCQKEENIAPETISATLTMHADVDATKTYLGEGNTVLWGTGESVQLYVGSGETSKFVASASTDEYNGNASASFTFNIEGVAAAETYSLGGIYPASAALSDNNNPKLFKTILPQTQSAEVGKYDPTAYIMVLKPQTVSELPSEYIASFRRATALNKITLTGVKEDITTVEITVPDGMALAGRRYFDLTSGESGEVYYDKSNTIIVNSNFTGSSIDVWFCSWGVELAAENELTVRMKNANKSFTRTIKANEKGIKFVEGDLNTLKIDMSSATEESFDSFEGEWLITGTTGGKTYAAKAYSSGNNLSSPVEITVENDGTIYEVDGLDQCKMTFTKITEGDYKGMYTIQDANGKYLYAASSSGNHLKAGQSASSAHYYWTVECKDGNYSIVASKSSNRNVMQFNSNNGSPIFSCYSSASQTAVVLYPYSNVKVDTTPRIYVNENSYSVSYDATTLDIPYSVKNINGAISAIVADGATMSNVAAVVTGDKVTVSFDANEDSEAKTATIVLSYEGATSVNVTLTHAEKPAEGGGSTGGYTLITDLSQITSGEYVIAAKVNNKYYAMSKTSFTSKINGTEVTVSNNTIAKSAATFYVVTITKSGSSYTIQSGGNYLTYVSGTNLGSARSAYNWTIAKGTKGTFRFTSATSTRGLVFRAGTYNQFGGYALSNVTANGSEYYDVELFKLN